MKHYYVDEENNVIEFRDKNQMLDRYRSNFLDFQNVLVLKYAKGELDEKESKLLEILYRVLNYGVRFVSVEEMDELLSVYGLQRLPYRYPYQRVPKALKEIQKIRK